MDMYYIYVYINKINGHKYVGQTNNLERRIREHRSCAKNSKSSSYNDLIHKKIRQYGEENFDIQVLEKIYTDDIEVVNKQEQYWIKKLETFRGFGKGYNSDYGGNNKNHSSILDQTQIKFLKEEIKQGVSYYDLEKKYNISASFISSINHGIYCYDEQEQYPLYKYYKENKDYDELIELLRNSDLTLKQIAERLNIGYSTVKKINSGALKKDLYPVHPIRSYKFPKALKTINLLQNSDYSIKEIAQLVGYSQLSVKRINNGETHRQSNLTYPLRNL